MCGIAGALEEGLRDGEWQAVLRAMTQTLVHRGPDHGGLWFDCEAGVGLGHRRLSIIDLAPTGHQPMVSHCSRYVIVFNGEVYNFKALRQELQPLGYRFRGHSDTEVVLATISEWGLEGALSQFIGMFAFGLWDRQAHRLSLVRDRLGKKPLFYGWAGKTFMFASELKALRTHPGLKLEINRDAVASLMRHNYIPAPVTIYKGIYKLPPGCWLSVGLGEAWSSPSPVSYWSAREVAERGVADPLSCSEEEATTQLETLLRDAVRLRMEADVPLGAFLSGGIDSSTVVALMQAQSSSPVKTFTIGFTEADYNEAEYAKGVAQHLGTDHTELYVRPEEALAVIPELPTLYDEPFADSSQIPVALISKLARQQVTVSLSGDGGDEIFAGYDRYVWASKIWAQIGWLPHRLRKMAAAAIRVASPETLGGLLHGIGSVLPGQLRQRDLGQKLHRFADMLAMGEPETMYLSLVSHWKNPSDLVYGAREQPTPLTDPGQRPDLPDFLHRMMYLDTVTYLPDDLLVKLDRASMGVSLEARTPLLDHRVVELGWRIPLSLKLKDGQGKWLLRRVLSRYVPKDLTDRPKMGFGVPIGSWLRGPLRDWAEALLDESRLRQEGFLNPQPIRDKWAEHLSGTRNWQYLLWNVLMFEAWLERWGSSREQALL